MAKLLCDASNPETPPEGYVTDAKTIGDHLRNRRLRLGLLQRELAKCQYLLEISEKKNKKLEDEFDKEKDRLKDQIEDLEDENEDLLKENRKLRKELRD